MILFCMMKRTTSAPASWWSSRNWTSASLCGTCSRPKPWLMRYSSQKKQGATHACINGGSRTLAVERPLFSRARTVKRGVDDFTTGGALRDPD